MSQPTRSGLTISFVGTFLLLIASGCSEPPVPALLWEYPLRQVEYPGSSYLVSIDNGVVVVGIRGSELHALDAKDWPGSLAAGQRERPGVALSPIRRRGVPLAKQRTRPDFDKGRQRLHSQIPGLWDRGVRPRCPERE